MTEIAEEMWEDLVGTLKSVTIITGTPEVEAGNISSNSDVMPLTPPEKREIRVTVTYLDHSVVFKVKEHVVLSKVMKAFCKRIGGCEQEYRFSYYGNVIMRYDTSASIGLQDGDEIIVQPRQVGGKPVIYLFSPLPVEASVKLALAPQWDFSAIYPVVSIEKPGVEQAHHQEVTWRVQTQSNGDLKELNTGLDVAYLFWEAHTNPGSAAPKVSNAREGSIEAFNPNAALLNDDNSVVLPVSKVTPYLDQALHALGLHTEARTSFITYWLPSILKHTNIAFRFVPQASYEQAAPLTVSPAPDVVSRVFMVFQGVTDEEVSQWANATAKVREDVSFWQTVVGIDRERTLDASLFRVVEWGGMEVRPPAKN
ncbi:hypothetical protein D9613_010307 [Agrocybe pediades]|uniref:Ubiquitin-like domain-containing protein n=1 Tax=Agrocybe pediades TaxID=84607 RepID=A0A8H4VHY2_9AGAR|nr:hypothetical protein D9613_010307 [Agrocybe pediades]